MEMAVTRLSDGEGKRTKECTNRVDQERSRDRSRLIDFTYGGLADSLYPYPCRTLSISLP